MLDDLGRDEKQKRFLQSERSRVLSCRLDRMDTHQLHERSAALNRLDSLDATERESAQREIESLYGVSHSGGSGTGRRRSRHRSESGS
jgi:hypothetical protein